MKNIVLLLSSLLLSVVGFSQVITTSNTLTPEQLVQNILLGQGVTATNVTFNGTAANALAVQPNAFDFTATGFPFTDGVYLTTTNAASVAFDPDLNAISTNTITNGAILEFDFIPTGDSLTFNYMFASAEYPTYVCSGFNDVFGFFISGPGIAGPYSNGAENIALVPGTNVPVAINTVNSGVAGGAGTPATCAAQDPNWTANSVYYTTMYANYSGAGYNGGTVSLPAVAQLQCGQTYHIKIAVSNVGDQALNSGVYLEGDSFSSNSIEVETTSAITGSFTDTLLAEGCTQITLSFIRPAGSDTIADTLALYPTGTVDLINDITGFQDSIFFPVGVDTVAIVIDPIDDGITEPMEFLTIGYWNVTLCGDSIYDSLNLYIVDKYPLTWDLLDVTTQCIANQDVVEVTNFDMSIPPFSTTWSFGSTNNPANLPQHTNNIDTNVIYVTITDGCGDLYYDSMLYIANQTFSLDSVTSLPATQCGIGGTVQGHTSGTTGPVNYSWTGPTAPGSSTSNPWNNIGAGWYYLTASDNVCSDNDSVEVVVSPVAFQIDSLVPTPTYECFTDGSVTAYVSAPGGGETYSWTSSAVNTPATSSASTWNNITTGWYYLTVDYGTCSDSDSIFVDVTPSTLTIDSLVMTPSSACYDNGAVAGYYSGATGSETLTWTSPQPNPQPGTTFPTWNNLMPGWYYFTLNEGTCVENDSIEITVLPQTLAVGNLTSLPSNTCVANGSVQGAVVGETGPVDYLWTSSVSNTPTSVTTIDWNNVNPGWYYFVITEGNCTAIDSVEVGIVPAPIADFVPSVISGCVPLNVSFTNQSSNASSYMWDFGNGNVVTVNSSASQQETFDLSSTVMLVAYDAANCADTAYVDIEVIGCGCTDPNALNYNPLATIDDGSCIYPTPVVVAPNIFTPNGDNSNDVYFLDVQYAEYVEFIIMNRWGNVMFEGEGGTPFPFWDGTTPNGNMAADGTYFVKYKVTGINGIETVEGQNFVQLVSK